MIVVGGWPGRNVVGFDGRFGVLPAEMSTGGDLANPLAESVDGGDTTTEFMLTASSIPGSGAVALDDDGTYIHVGAADGAYLLRGTLYTWAPGGPVVNRGEVRVVSKFGTLAAPVLLGPDVKFEGADVRPVVSIVF